MLQIQNMQKRWGKGLVRSLQIETYIQHYHKRYLHNIAKYEQQKAAFRWLRAQGAISEKLTFRNESLSGLSSCAQENFYLQKTNNAIWVRDSKTLLTNEEQRSLLVNMAKMHGINHLFLWLSSDLLTTHSEEYAKFIQTADNANLTVDAYSTHPNWLLSSKENVMNLLDQLIAFNRNRVKHMQFNGIRLHLSTRQPDSRPLTTQLSDAHGLLQYLAHSYPQNELNVGVDIDAESDTELIYSDIETLFPLIDNLAILTSIESADKHLQSLQENYKKTTSAPAQYWLGLDLNSTKALNRQAAAPQSEQLAQKIRALCLLYQNDEYFLGVAYSNANSFQGLLLNQAK